MTNASKRRLRGYVDSIRSLISSLETSMANADSEESFNTLETAMSDAEEQLARAESFLKFSKQLREVVKAE